MQYNGVGFVPESFKGWTKAKFVAEIKSYKHLNFSSADLDAIWSLIQQKLK